MITLPDRPEVTEGRLHLVYGSDDFMLPEESWITSMPFKVRYKGVARALSHGMVNTGDRKVDGRDITITVLVDEKTTEDYFSTIDELKEKFYRNSQRLYITEHRYITLDSLSSFKDKGEKGYKNRRATLEVDFKCTDPFFYNDIIADTGLIPLANVNNVTLNNYGTAQAVPIIDIVASGSVVSFGIRNLTNEMGFTYNDPRFINGKLVCVDSGEGTVKFGDYNNILHGSNMINSINNYHGSFILLEHGANILEVDNAQNISIRIQFYERYL